MKCRPNDQKAFYWLLHNYRDKQLEDFKPELAHSMSDYHHLKPGTWKKRVSTCEFSRPHANGHSRSVSRFTVISNAAETEVGTIQSYDPYRGSPILRPCDSQVTHTKITVHRDQSSRSNPASHAARLRSGSYSRHPGVHSSRVSNAGRPVSSRGSLTSLQSNRQGTPRARGPVLRHKRGVDFSHIRTRSGSVGPSKQIGNSKVGSTSNTADQVVSGDRASRSQSPELPVQPNGTYPKAKGAPVRGSPVNDLDAMFTEELRHFSNNIAKDCDEAFKSSLIGDTSVGSSMGDCDRRQRDSPFTFSLEGTPAGTPVTDVSSVRPWDCRPLPPLPSEETLNSCHLDPAEKSASNIYHADDENVVEHVAVPVVFLKHGDRRVVSAPAHTHSSRKPVGMPSINEDKALNVATGDKARIVSAPPHTPPRQGRGQAHGMEYLSTIENTIRVVHSPSAPNPVKIPEPFDLRKPSAVEDANSGSRPGRVDEECQRSLSRDARGVVKKKKPWFKRPTKASTDSGASTAGSHDQTTLVGSDAGPEYDVESTRGASARKKSFNFPFWTSHKNSDLKMSIAGKFRQPISTKQELTWEDARDDVSNGFGVIKKPRSTKKASWRDSNGTDGSRNIEVKQNWLARLFRVKPATSYMCMTMSRKRARQEVSLLLREWRQYGIRGIQVDKQRNIIFARVGAKNCKLLLPRIGWMGRS